MKAGRKEKSKADEEWEKSMHFWWLESEYNGFDDGRNPPATGDIRLNQLP
jgi:hypothetical protein